MAVLGDADLDAGLRREVAREMGTSAKGQRPVGRAPDAEAAACGGGAGRGDGWMRRHVGEEQGRRRSEEDRESLGGSRACVGVRRMGVRLRQLRYKTS